MNFHAELRHPFRQGFFLLAAGTVLGLCGTRLAVAQTSWSVSTAADLAQALGSTAGSSSDRSLITFKNTITATNQFFINSNVTIDGGGYALNMDGGQGAVGFDRAFFVAGGNVTFQNLTISNGNALGGAGGLGNGGGGGGAGLGGGIFVGSGSYAAGNGSTVYGISAPQVTISNVTFSGNQANGGTGGNARQSAYSGQGGGGGMGGGGGSGASYTWNGSTGPWSGGGGGFGLSAFGGSAEQSGSDIVGGNGGTGAFVLGTENPSTYAGAGFTNPSQSGFLAGSILGGNYGGGGGVGEMYAVTGYPNGTTVGGLPGGGGGVGGGDATGSSGGQGGFGGGGGASAYGESGSGGAGGFGGGGGGLYLSSSGHSGGGLFEQAGRGGAGGFGGGGGGGGGNAAGGVGGFGAGSGDSSGNGGGGLGAGGALFVMPGASVTIQNSSISGGSVSGGASGGGSAGAGSALGSGIFLYGANLTYDVASGALTVSDSITDGFVLGSGLSAGLTKTGSGTLVLSNPANSWFGMTQVQAGTLEVYTVSLPQFAPIDVSANANLTFGSVANTSGNFVAPIIGNGSVTIGDADNLGAGGVITLSGGNTYSGGTVVNGSTLRAGSAQAFGNAGGLSLWSSTASGTAGTVNGATVDLGGFSTTVAGLFGDGRATVTNSSTTAATLTVTGSSSQYQGQISGPIALTVASTGTFTLGGSTTSSGATTVAAGKLLVTGTLGGSGDGVTVASGAALGGTGTINESVAVQSGGTLAAGLGQLTVDSLILENGANLSFALGAAGGQPTSAPILIQTGMGLDVGRNVTVNLTTGTGFGAGVYSLIYSPSTFDQSNGFSGWSIVGLPSAYSATFHLGQASDAHPGLSLVVAVPEPSTLVLVAAGVIAAAGWHGRRSGPGAARRN